MSPEPVPCPDAPVDVPDAQWRALADAHATPPRAYHNLDHVHAVLRLWREVRDGPGWDAPAETFFAVLYHDAIYVPGRDDNEARSAVLAREHLARWQRGVDAGRVAQLIELTARHGRLEPGDVDRDAALLLDCDMAILGAPPAEFAAYDRAIAAEYRGVVPAWMYRLKRRRFLKGLLARERLFLSDYFHAGRDAQARINLRRAVTEKR